MTMWIACIVKNDYGVRLMWNIGRGFYGLLISLVWKTSVTDLGYIHGQELP
jgi:hypothetical protein